MSKFCGKCGAELEDKIKFCAKCGADVSNEQRAPAKRAPVVKKSGQKTKKNLIISIVVLLAGIWILSSIFGGGKYPFEEGATVEATVQADKKITVSDMKTTGWQLEIPKNSLDDDVSLTMNVLSEEEAVNYRSSDFEFIGTPVNIIGVDEEHIYFSQPVTVTLQIPKDQRISKEEADDYLVAYYNGESWEYIFPDITEVSKGYISFETYHFSFFSAVKLTDEEKIKLYAKKMGVQTWEAEEQENAFSDKVMETFNEAFEKMGITDQTVKGKLLRSIAKEYDFGNLLVSTDRGDLADFGVKCGEMAANALIKHLKVGDALMDNIGGKGAAIATGLLKGALQLKDGKYTDAAKELASAFIGYFPAGRAYQATIEVIGAGIASWKDYELSEAYKNYVKDATGSSTTVSNDDWNLMCTTQMRGYLIRLQDEAKNTYCEVNKISRSKLDKDKTLSERIASQAEATLRKTFEKRLASENAIEIKEIECAKIIEGFKEDMLLKRGSFGFDFDMDIDNRLRTLFNVRKNILDIFGGKMPLLSIEESAEANLNEAITKWISFGPENRGEFYKWLEEKGYQIKDDTSQANTEGEYVWVLREVVDYENSEKWKAADDHGSYIVSHGYSQGTYTASKTYEGDNDDVSGTLGISATFSGMPDIIYPDQAVSLEFSFVTTENSVVNLSFGGSAGADFDEYDVGPGGVTRSAKDFVNEDGEGNFKITNNNDASHNETLTAQLGSGSEGDLIALRTTFYMGVSMGTNYIYEWKQIG